MRVASRGAASSGTAADWRSRSTSTQTSIRSSLGSSEGAASTPSARTRPGTVRHPTVSNSTSQSLAGAPASRSTWPTLRARRRHTLARARPLRHHCLRPARRRGGRAPAHEGSRTLLRVGHDRPFRLAAVLRVVLPDHAQTAAGSRRLTRQHPPLGPCCPSPPWSPVGRRVCESRRGDAPAR